MLNQTFDDYLQTPLDALLSPPPSMGEGSGGGDDGRCPMRDHPPPRPLPLFGPESREGGFLQRTLDSGQ